MTVRYLDIWPGVRLTDDDNPWRELKTSSLLSSDTPARKKNRKKNTIFKGISRKADERNRKTNAPAMMTAKKGPK